tara:strand:- start:336 stop:575 length:240 start_codon:yes stop_codon:yes gene_type:complete
MKVKVWGVMEGPISVEEVEDDNIPQGSNYFLVCKSEIDGVMGEDNFWFEDFESAYEWKKYFLKNIEPLVVDMPDTPEYN